MPDSCRSQTMFRLTSSGSYSAIPKANDIQSDRSQQFQARLVFDALFQMSGKQTRFGDHGAELLCTERLDGEPRLQGPETTRQVRPKIAWPRRSSRHSSLLPAKVRGGRSERRLMNGAVPDQDKPGVVRHLSPFVKVEGHGIGLLDASEQGRQIRRQHRQRPERAIHMEPNLFALCDACDSLQIVDRADIDSTGSCGDQKRNQA